MCLYYYPLQDSRHGVLNQRRILFSRAFPDACFARVLLPISRGVPKRTAAIRDQADKPEDRSSEYDFASGSFASPINSRRLVAAAEIGDFDSANYLAV